MAELTSTRGLTGAVGAIGRVGTWADNVAATSIGERTKARVMAIPLEVFKREIGRRRAEPGHEVVLVEGGLDELEFIPAMARIKTGDLRQHEFQVQQQVAHAGI